VEVARFAGQKGDEVGDCGRVGGRDAPDEGWPGPGEVVERGLPRDGYGDDGGHSGREASIHAVSSLARRLVTMSAV
jgi:hypothetical protein